MKKKKKKIKNKQTKTLFYVFRKNVTLYNLMLFSDRVFHNNFVVTIDEKVSNNKSDI